MLAANAGALIAETCIQSVAVGRGQCLSWVKFGSRRPVPRSPLYPQERNWSDGPVRSEKCQKRTDAAEQTASYSINVSARCWSRNWHVEAERFGLL